MLRVAILFFLLNISKAEALPPSDEVDIKHYVFKIELNDSTNVIRGEAEVTVLFRKNSSKVILDLAGQDQDGRGMRVLAVSAGGSQRNFSHSGDFLQILLDKESVAGSEMVFRIRYSGIPKDGLIISRNKFGDRTFFGDNWPNRAHHWLPVIDHPSDKATVEFKVVAPPTYEVIGNGVRREESILNERQKLTHWSESVPLPTKVMVFGAAKFAIQYADPVGDVRIEHWVYPQNREQGFHDFAATSKILAFFIDRIGPYPYKKLVNVQSKTRFGGMENASNIFYTESAVNGKADHDDLIAHEIAHQWFGNSASEADWHHVWLSEGFATYFSHLYTEFSRGESARAADMQEDRKKVIEFFKKQPLPVVFTTLPPELLDVLNTNSYQKGAWILHMLRVELGDEAFNRGVKQYYSDFTTGNAVTSDFQKIMETASGRDLAQFFKQWLYSPGHPVLRSSWKFDPRQQVTEVVVEQIQPGLLFEFPLDIAWTGPGIVGPGSEQVRMAGKTAKFTIKTGFKPTSIRLDPGVNLLFEDVSKN